MEKEFVCPICGNKNKESIGFLNNIPYCRECISFKNKEKLLPTFAPKNASIFLSYKLSKEQKELSDKLIDNYKNGIDSLVHAVCGSGKTEISLGVIQYAIKCGEKVAFAVPRKDVVIELHDRLKHIFKYNKVVAVYGSHNDTLEGDIIVLTTHQLFRYTNYFSLIILDEVDAFPFKGNKVLNHMFFNALCGHYIMMSATPTKDVIELFKKENKCTLRLDVRFHRFPLPEPKIYIRKTFFLKFFLLLIYLRKFLNNEKQVFVFCPTIEKCEFIHKLVHFLFKNGTYVHSKCEDRELKIRKFKEGRYRYLITTSVLERGVTVKNLQVIVFNSDHSIYDQGTLVQIAGRAGRKKEAPEGEVIFIGKRLTRGMTYAIADIKKSNEILQKMF